MGAPWRPSHPIVAGRPGPPLRLSRCALCGTAWIAAPEEEQRTATELYGTGAYAPGSGLVERLPSALKGLLDRDRLRLIGPLAPGARVIEVGSGRGHLLEAMRSRGIDALGIEPHAPSPAPGTLTLPLERTKLPDGAADAVVFWHSLEHLHRPAAALERSARWLKPDGRLVVAVPNLDSAQARLGGDRWFHQDVPRHRTQFTFAGLIALLERTGFACTATRTLMLEQNVLGMWLTLLNLATVNRDVPFRFLKRDLSYARARDAWRDAFISAIGGPLLLAPAAIAELAAGLAGRPGTVVVHGRLV